MSNDNAGSTGGSRSRALQGAGGEAGGGAPKEKEPKAPKAAPVAASPEIDYNKLAAALAPMLAPIMRPKGVETADLEVGHMPDIILEDGTLATGGAALEAIDKPLNSDYVAALAFMEEELEIMVHTSDDANAENPIIVGVNGIFKVFHRGVPTLARRKFVEGLIVKTTRITTPETLNGAGERCNIIKQHNSHKYAFVINRDPNPKGREWLTRRMAEAI